MMPTADVPAKRIVLETKILKTALVYGVLAAAFEIANLLTSFLAGNGAFTIRGISFYGVWFGVVMAFAAIIPPICAFMVFRRALLATKGQRLAFFVLAGLHIVFLAAMAWHTAAQQKYLFFKVSMAPAAILSDRVDAAEAAYYVSWIESAERTACNMLVHYLIEDDDLTTPRVDYEVTVFGFPIPMRHSAEIFIAAENADACIPYIIERSEKDVSERRLDRALYLLEAARQMPTTASMRKRVLDHLFAVKRVIREQRDAEWSASLAAAMQHRKMEQ